VDPIMARAKKALGNALISTKQGLTLDPAGYVREPSENLIDGISLESIEADFRQGDGNELGGKFRAAHSFADYGNLACCNFGLKFERARSGLQSKSMAHCSCPRQPIATSGRSPQPATCF
jgi:hypothetical protein